jgi:hypothetical protein
MIRSALLAIGIVLSSATQMRVAGLPVGPGELIILLWIVVCVFDLLAEPASRDLTALYRLGIFWFLFALALGVGAFVGFLVEDHVSVDLLLHDTFAYLLMCALSCIAVSLPNAPVQFRHTAWNLILFGNIGIAIQIAAGWEFISLPSVDPWYWDRFRGWAENPNQLAIMSCALALLAVHLSLSSSGFVRIVGLLGAVGPLVAGRLSKSDTFISVMVFSGVILMALRLRHWLLTTAPRSRLRYALAVLTIALALPAAISVWPLATMGASDAEAFALSLTKDKGGTASARTFDLRLYLWDEAMQAGLRSGSLGLGPGPHLDPPYFLTHRDYNEHFEAHNTPLDVFLQGGILGVAALAGLLASTALQLYRRRSDALLTLLIALTIFSNAHFLLRHPIIWFAVGFCVSEGCTRPPQVRFLPAQHARI